jgi:glycosyltransferase involved in cell wall biosynthesis
MRIGVIGDFGVNKGGGDFVLLNILEALSTQYEVTLITSTPSGFYETTKLFNKKITGINIKKIKLMPFSKHPYTIAYMAKKVAKDYTYDLLVVSDDIPKCLSDRKVISYAHFPHSIRIKFNEHLMQKYTQSITGKLLWWFHRKLFTRYYSMQTVSDKWFFVINSELTLKNMKEFMHLNPEKVTLLNPPVESSNLNRIFTNRQLVKENLILSIGWFEPVKGTVDTIKAFSKLPNKNQYKLNLIGFAGNPDYIHEVKNAIQNSGCPQNIDLILNAERDLIVENLLKAKVLVHSALREHFGIAVVEGMAMKCIPIVRKGFNGPWIEITEEGKYGLGFETIEECSVAIEEAIKSYGNFNLNSIVVKALEFDESIFRQKFGNIVLKFMDQKS